VDTSALHSIDCPVYTHGLGRLGKRQHKVAEQGTEDGAKSTASWGSSRAPAAGCWGGAGRCGRPAALAGRRPDHSDRPARS